MSIERVRRLGFRNFSGVSLQRVAGRGFINEPAGNVVTAVIAAVESPDVIAITATQTNPYGSNVALQANGGTATASSQFSADYPATTANDGVIGANSGGTGVFWASSAGPPQWLRVDFNATYSIGKVVVFSLQTAPGGDTNPQGTTNFACKDYTVEGWNGSGWDTLATITGNANVQNVSTFTPYSTTAIRINVSATGTGTIDVLIDEVQAFPLAGVTAVLAATETPDVIAIAAKSLNVGALAVTEPADVVAITAKVINAATLAATESPDVISITASSQNVAALAATESPDVIAITAVEANVAALAVVEAPDVIAINALAGGTAQIQAVEQPDVIDIQASVTQLAALAAVESPDLIAIVARQGMVAVIAATEQPDVVHIVAKALNVASLAATDQPDAIAISAGSFVVGSLAGFEEPDAVAIEASQYVNAVIALQEDADVVSIISPSGTIISLPACLVVSDSALGLALSDSALGLEIGHRSNASLGVDDSLNCEGGECNTRG